MNKLNSSLAGLLALTLAACGGSSNNSAPPPVAATDAVPDSASQSSAGMNAWLTALASDLTELKEPLSAAAFSPPTAEDTEPQALN